MAGTFQVTGSNVPLSEIQDALQPGVHLELTQSAHDLIAGSRNFLDSKLEDSQALFYGISTGFGSQYHVRINQEEMAQLQLNLVRSHAAGAGEPVPREISRVILLLKILSLVKGNSGVRVELVQQLIAYYNEDLIPVMYEFGSLGASGDLAPLAHLALTLIGEGEFYGKNGPEDAGKSLKSRGIGTLQLVSKEGLALINGTQFSTGYGIWCYFEALKLAEWTDITAALAADSFDVNLSPFDARIHEVRPHDGQQAVARHMRSLLHSSGVNQRPGKHLQDPYAFRCIPQVHGASLTAIRHTGTVLETEANSVTDNPLIFPNSDGILSGGNFHAQPVALVLDYMAIALAELGNISERRTYQLLSAARGLPACLVPNAGLQSGLMIAQYTAASVVNRNKILCTPASIDSIPSSMGQEDHVSMAANSATKLFEILTNLKTIISIELLCAVQAIDLKRYNNQLSAPLQAVYQEYREHVDFIKKDIVLHDLIAKGVDVIEKFRLPSTN